MGSELTDEADGYRVFIIKKQKPLAQESVTIVGDWYSAVSVSAKMGKGYRQTIFTRHARTVRRQIEEFDEEFSDILQHNGISEGDSRQAAIKELEEICQACSERIARPGESATTTRKPNTT